LVGADGFGVKRAKDIYERKREDNTQRCLTRWAHTVFKIIT